jgi:hypothetical protein
VHSFAYGLMAKLCTKETPSRLSSETSSPETNTPEKRKA